MVATQEMTAGFFEAWMMISLTGIPSIHSTGLAHFREKMVLDRAVGITW